ncbi:TPA: phage repressor protein, partial [Streptococcus agalactiae]
METLRFFSSNLNDLLNETSTKQVELSKATGIPPSTLTG